MDGGNSILDVWILLLIVLLTLGLVVPFWVIVQFALISDKTRDEIHRDDL
jgi:preprotein translocase subunit Sec63